MKALFALFLLVGLAAASEVPLLAVEDLRPRGIARDEAAILSERLRAVLLQTGKVRVLERSEMDRILKEQAFQASGACERGECAVEIGRILAVDRMVVGTAGKIGDQYTLGARILDVQSGEVLFDANQDGALSLDELLAKSVPQLGERLAQGALVARSSGRSEAGFGDLQVELDDSTATLRLDGRLVPGRSPFLFEGLPSGTHLLEARTATRRGIETVTLDRDDLRKIVVHLDSGTSILKVFSEPSGASIFLDGDFASESGRTPMKLDPVLVGTHRVVLRKDGWMDTAVAASVQLDRAASLKVRLRPAGYLVLEPAPEVSVALVRKNDTLRANPGAGPIALPPGRWRVVLRDRLWEPLVEDVEIRQGRVETLQPVRHFATLVLGASERAEVWVDGEPRGNTPLKIDTLEPGSHTVLVRAAGKQNWTQKVDLRRGDEVRLDARLESRFAWLRVRTGHAATITLDGAIVGPLEPETTRQREAASSGGVETQVLTWVWASDTLVPGPHRLVVAAPDRIPWERNLTLAPGLTAGIYAGLPLSAEAQSRRVERIRLAFRFLTGGVGVAAAVMMGRSLLEQEEAADRARAEQAGYDAAGADFEPYKMRYDQARDDERSARTNSALAGSIAAIAATGFALTWVF